MKRDQREFLEEPPDALKDEGKTERQARRLMFQTITSWIEEQRELKKRLAQDLILVEERAD